MEKEQVEMSKEELDNRRKEITNFYKQSIPHLKVQKEYEELLCAIEEFRAKRIQAQMFLAQAYGPEESEEESEAAKDFEKVQPIRRTLKKD